MQNQQKFIIQTFITNGEQYLYELQIRAQNSIIKIFNNLTKLLTIQRIRLPANCLVYGCQNFIITISQAQICLYQIPNVSIHSTCQNPGVKQVKFLSYNPASNLIFLLTPNKEIYYIMPQVGRIKTKLIFNNNQPKFNFTETITKFAVDYKSHLYLYCQQAKRMYVLKYEWNSNDKLVSMQKKQGIIGIWCRFQWKVITKMAQQINCNYYNLSINDDRYQNSVPQYNQQNQPIVKLTQNILLYLYFQDKQRMRQNQQCQKNTLVIIKDGEQQSIKLKQEDVKQIKYKPNYAKSQFLFQLKKQKYNKINLILHPYTKQIFQTEILRIPQKQMDQDCQLNKLAYFYNNITFMFTEKGLNSYFYSSILQYLDEQVYNQNMTVNQNDIVSRLLERLFIKSQPTIIKLTNHLSGMVQQHYPDQKLNQFIGYIKIILSNITQTLSRQYLIIKPKKYSQNQIYQNQLQDKYKQLQTQLQNIIHFCSLLRYVIQNKQNQYQNYNIHTQVNRQQRDSMMEIQILTQDNVNININNINKYQILLHKSKCIYLANQILYKHLIYYNKKVEKNNDNILQQYKMGQLSLSDEQYTATKVGVRACHQYFHPMLANKTNLYNQFNIIFQFLLQCQNYYHAAYMYLLLYPHENSVPYINDDQSIELIKFIIQMRYDRVMRDRDLIKIVMKKLPKIAGKALLINQRSFLQFLCALSINCGQQKSCLAILLSGVTVQWPISSQMLILQCLVLCNRTLLAYQLIERYNNNKIQYGQLLDKFIQFCLKHRKISDLISLSGNRKQSGRIIRMRLENQLGDDLREIDQLMNLINKNQNNRGRMQGQGRQ